jgi:hypothetical protein
MDLRKLESGLAYFTLAVLVMCAVSSVTEMALVCLALSIFLVIKAAPGRRVA